MIYVSLESAKVADSERHNDIAEDTGWDSIASSQGATKDIAKALMLDNVLEMLNSEELFVTDIWLRLVYFGDDHKEVIETEVF